jgi:hypothetical protein
MQQHDEHPGKTLFLAPLDHSVVLRSLWPSLATEDSRALRLCCSTVRDAVEAQAGRLASAVFRLRCSPFRRAHASIHALPAWHAGFGRLHSPAVAAPAPAGGCAPAWHAHDSHALAPCMHRACLHARHWSIPFSGRISVSTQGSRACATRLIIRVAPGWPSCSAGWTPAWPSIVISFLCHRCLY